MRSQAPRLLSIAAQLQRDLGFDAPTANSLDATSDRDFALEFVQALAILALHLSRWAEDMMLFSTQEYGFVLVAGSRTPRAAARCRRRRMRTFWNLPRAKAARVLGASTTLLVTVKGLPLAYNKDMQETQLPLFESVEGLLPILELLSSFTHKLSFRLQVMENAAESWVPERNGSCHLSLASRRSFFAAPTTSSAKRSGSRWIRDASSMASRWKNCASSHPRLRKISIRASRSRQRLIATT